MGSFVEPVLRGSMQEKGGILCCARESGRDPMIIYFVSAVAVFLRQGAQRQQAAGPDGAQAALCQVLTLRQRGWAGRVVGFLPNL